MGPRLCRVAPYAAVASLFTVLCTVQYAPRTFFGGASLRLWATIAFRCAYGA